MTGVKPKKFAPKKENVEVYNRLYAIYKKLHDSFRHEGL